MKAAINELLFPSYALVRLLAFDKAFKLLTSRMTVRINVTTLLLLVQLDDRLHILIAGAPTQLLYDCLAGIGRTLRRLRPSACFQLTVEDTLLEEHHELIFVHQFTINEAPFLTPYL